MENKEVRLTTADLEWFYFFLQDALKAVEGEEFDKSRLEFLLYGLASYIKFLIEGRPNPALEGWPYEKNDN